MLHRKPDYQAASTADNGHPWSDPYLLLSPHRVYGHGIICIASLPHVNVCYITMHQNHQLKEIILYFSKVYKNPTTTNLMILVSIRPSVRPACRVRSVMPTVLDERLYPCNEF